MSARTAKAAIVIDFVPSRARRALQGSHRVVDADAPLPRDETPRRFVTLATLSAADREAVRVDGDNQFYS